MIPNPEVIRSRWSAPTWTVSLIGLTWLLVGHPGVVTQDVLLWPERYVMASVPTVAKPEQPLIFVPQLTSLDSLNVLTWGSGASLTTSSILSDVTTSGLMISGSAMTFTGTVTASTAPIQSGCASGTVLRLSNGNVWVCR